jgi:uracil-DNA glycosylase
MQNELFQTSNEPIRLTRWQPSDWPVAAGWGEAIAEFLSSQAGLALGGAIEARINAGAVIYPPTPFKALELTSLEQVRVVILGQDPYHGAGQAQGLAFSVASGVKVPPSLRNIFKEIGRETEDMAIASPKDGSLVRWARQGVLLLNTCLTVEDGLPASHAKLGWEGLTDALITLVAERNKNVVFMLWGAHAQAKQALLQTPKSLANQHLVLCANHPSPLSAMRPPVPFIGCGHFELANAFLIKQGLPSINW